MEIPNIDELTDEELVAIADQEFAEDDERYDKALAEARQVYEAMTPAEKKEIEDYADGFNKRWEITADPERKEQDILEHLADRMHGLDHMAEKMASQDHTENLLLDPDHPYHKIAAMDRDELYKTFPQLSPEGLEALREAGLPSPLEQTFIDAKNDPLFRDFFRLYGDETD